MLKKIWLGIAIFVLSISAYSMKLEKDVVIDEKGNTVKIKNYNRVIILDPAVTETFYMIGAEDKISAIGITMRSKIHPVEKTKDLPSVGNIVNPSLEKILSFSPDLVILGGMSAKLGENLKELNIPFLITDAGTLEAILKNIIIYGHLTGKEEEASKLYANSLNQMESLKEKIKENPLNLKGGVLYSVSPMMAFNSKALPGQILNLLGVKNIADNLVGNRPIVSQEFLLQENPDFLAGAMSIKKPEDILNANPVIKQIKAGKENNVFIIDSDKILRGSPRIFQGIEELYEKMRDLQEE